MWASSAKNGRGPFAISAWWRAREKSLKKPDVPQAPTHHRHLPLSRQRPDPGTVAAGGPDPRPDPQGRPPLRHRKRAVRVRSGRAEMAAKAAFPDVAAGRMAGRIADPFRRCQPCPDHPPQRRGRSARQPRDRRGPGRDRAVLCHGLCRPDQGAAKSPDQSRPQFFRRRPQGGLDHQCGKRPRHREHGRPPRPSPALPRQPLCRGLAGLARIRPARPDAGNRWRGSRW